MISEGEDIEVPSPLICAKSQRAGWHAGCLVAVSSNEKFDFFDLTALEPLWS